MIYAVGDIHGQHTMLLALLEALDRQPLREDDTLVFLGDYVDRGPGSRAVIEKLLELREQHSQIVFLRGNHEQLMLDARDGPPPELLEEGKMLALSEPMQLWLINGGVETLLSYYGEFHQDELLNWWEAIPEAHWQFLRTTQMEYITEEYHFVHAGLLPPGKTWEGAGMGLDPRLWIRAPFLSSRANFDGRLVVFGHTPQTSGRPLVQRNKIGLDTGAAFGGPLTAVALDAAEPGRKRPAPHFFQVRPSRS